MTAYTNKNNLTAMVESWGYFIGPTFTRNRYSNIPAILNAELNFLEFQRMDDTVPVAAFNGSFSRGWIPWGMHQVRGAEMKKIPSLFLWLFLFL